LFSEQVWIEYASILGQLGCTHTDVSYDDFLKAIETQQDSLPSTRKNALMVGDNLVHLMRLSSVYAGSVDFIYIDPPYNTGSKFVYQDTRKGAKHPILGTHAPWMGFMAQRLFFAKILLKDTGIIAISIDDYEQAHLKIVLDMVFGESNFIGTVAVARSKNGKGSKKNNFATNHEYLHIYGKTSAAKLRGKPDSAENYNLADEHGCYRVDGLFRKKGDASLRTDRPNMYYPLYYNVQGEVFTEPDEGLKETYPVDSSGIERRWLWGKETTRQNSWKLYASPSGVIYVKNYFGDGKRVKLRSLWEHNPSFYTEQATKEIKNIYGTKVFETPKSMPFIQYIVDTFCPQDGLTMDFFAGTGTLAHAVETLNSAHGANRTTWLMETDAAVPSNHAARKQGFKTIAEITEYRLNQIQTLFPTARFEIFELGS
jgi:adenine-specific DNA-methyltransferase